MAGTDRARKHSSKRDAILRVIRSTVSHPGAQWVYERLKPVIPALSLGTVYRNIKVFQEEKQVISVGVVNGEERFDGQVAPHPHFVCSRCGKIADLPCPGDQAIKGMAAAVPAAQPDFTIDYRKTVFYGLCGECRNAAPPVATAPSGAGDR
ncbi:transcriptional repressor [Spirochaetia bacterium]|nr:transcriptional repressor [Spirochaetia bacterium]